jgi:hypothetical protein
MNEALFNSRAAGTAVIKNLLKKRNAGIILGIYIYSPCRMCIMKSLLSARNPIVNIN